MITDSTIVYDESEDDFGIVRLSTYREVKREYIKLYNQAENLAGEVTRITRVKDTEISHERKVNAILRKENAALKLSLSGAQNDCEDLEDEKEELEKQVELLASKISLLRGERMNKIMETSPIISGFSESCEEKSTSTSEEFEEL